MRTSTLEEIGLSRRKDAAAQHKLAFCPGAIGAKVGLVNFWGHTSICHHFLLHGCKVIFRRVGVSVGSGSDQLIYRRCHRAISWVSRYKFNPLSTAIYSLYYLSDVFISSWDLGVRWYSINPPMCVYVDPNQYISLMFLLFTLSIIIRSSLCTVCAEERPYSSFPHVLNNKLWRGKEIIYVWHRVIWRLMAAQVSAELLAAKKATLKPGLNYKY